MAAMAVQRITEASPRGTITTAGSGRIAVKVIDAGWGSAGYYPADTLERAVNAGVFTSAPLHMHLDHPTAAEEEARPIGSLTTLSGIIDPGTVRWDPDQSAVLAEARLVGEYAPLIKEAAADIGVSIRGWADAKPGEAEGRSGLILTELLELASVDFVTHPGRGGAILEVLEAARPRVTDPTRPPVAEASVQNRREQLEVALRAQYATGDTYLWVRDYDEAQGLVWWEYSDTLYQSSFTIAADDRSCTLTSEPVEVLAVVTYQPVTPQTDSTTGQEAQHMDITQERHDELVAAEAALAQARTDTEAAKEAANRAMEALRDARIKAAGLSESAGALVTQMLAGQVLTIEAIDAAVVGVSAVATVKQGAPAGAQPGATSAAEAAEVTEYVNPFGRTIKV